jgi:ADP-ribosylglycohydrolase
MDPRLASLTDDLLPLDPLATVDLTGDVGEAHLVDHATATLLVGAIGDALGSPGEAMSRHEVRRRFGRLTDFVPWHGWTGGPTGTITDDTQLTIVIAEALVHGGGTIDPHDLVQRLLTWWPDARGIGRATDEALETLSRGVAWHRAGTPSAGNGAAMRAAPIGLAHHRDYVRLRDEAIVSAVVTHRDPTAILSTVVQAAMVAWCLHHPGDDPVNGGLMDVVEHVVTTMPDPAVPERHAARAGRPVRLGDRLMEVPRLLHLDADEIVDRWWNGAYVIESLPVALWAFLRHLDDPEEMLIETASMGHDSDTIASMAGNLAGAYHGTAWIPARWLDQLEHRETLAGLATALATP